jgi:hypothetical protein
MSYISAAVDEQAVGLGEEDVAVDCADDRRGPDRRDRDRQDLDLGDGGGDDGWLGGKARDQRCRHQA